MKKHFQQHPLNAFYLFHQRKGDAYLAKNELESAYAHYQRALDLNPSNFLLITRLAEHIYRHPSHISLLSLLRLAVPNALSHQGQYRNTFHLANAASVLNQKIMRANSACNSFALIPPVQTRHPALRSKIVLLTCVWQRPELTDIVLDYYRALQAQVADWLELVLLAVGSEGQSSRDRCEQHGFDYYEYPNSPLSSKWEYGLQQTRNHQPDGVVIVGSDDLINAGLLRHYVALLNRGLLFCGVTDGIFIDISRPTASIHWHGYGGKTKDHGMPWRLNESIGMGRLFSKVLLEKLDYSLWKDADINKSLDLHAKKRLNALGLLPIRYPQRIPITRNGQTFYWGQVARPMAEMEAIAVDIKLPDAGITAIEKYKRCSPGFTRIVEPWGFLERHFAESTVAALKKLHHTHRRNQTVLRKSG